MTDDAGPRRMRGGPTPGLTPSQTVGPFLSIGLHWDDGPHAVPDGTAGAVRIGGVLLDGAGDPVGDGVVETWQADADGAFAPRPGFRGLARSLTGADGTWEVLTVMPAPLPTPDGEVEAPHLDVSVFARGLLDRLVTRVYFPDQSANDTDPVLRAVPPSRRGTLVARAVPGGYRFDIRLQGHQGGGDETVFFDL